LISQIEATVATIPANYSSLWTALAPAYSSSATYAVGQYCTYNGNLYRCTTAITAAETWTSSHWTAVKVGNELSDLKSAIINTNDNIGVVIDLIPNIQKTGTSSFTFEPEKGYYSSSGAWVAHNSHANAHRLYKIPSGLYINGNTIEEGAKLVISEFSLTDGVYTRIRQGDGALNNTNSDYYYSFDYYKNGGYTNYPAKADCVVRFVEAGAITIDNIKNAQDEFLNGLKSKTIDYMAFLPDDDMGTLWEKAYYNSSGTYLSSSNYRTTRDFIPATIQSVSADTGYLLNIYYFDSTGAYLKRRTGLSSFLIFQHDYYKYKICVQASPLGSLDGVDWVGHITISDRPIQQLQIDKLSSDVGLLIEYGAIDLIDNNAFEKGSINSSGVDIPAGYAYRTIGFVSSNIKTVKAKTGKAIMVYLYNKSGVFQERQQNQFDYTFNHADYNYRIVVYNYPLSTSDDVSNMMPDDFVYMLSKQITQQDKNTCGTFTVNDGIITIDMNKARYTVKRVINESINVDTWRLYQGDLKKDGAIIGTLWSNSDVEGAIKISGEDDFVCGYHGDEIMTSAVILVDGSPLDTSNDIPETPFSEIALCVLSDVYHCNTSPTPSVVAFKRIKTLKFTKDGYTVSNRFIAKENLSITRGALAMVSAVKSNLLGDQMITYLGSNSDLQLYPCPDNSGSGDKPESKSNKPMTEGDIYLTGAVLKLKMIYGQDNPGYNPYFNNMTDQNRIKIYFDQYNSREVSAGDVMQDEFSVEIV